ncbi:MAG TPA: peptidase S10, partial [Acidimicrobiia bacterium]|nr:peptidase S10 [Acidimicrobiia bacterium]
DGAKTPDPKEFFGQKRDLESLCEFAGRWLSRHDRWGSPVFIAGESYGGYRVGRLVRTLQEDAGIGLNGAILISPALEVADLFGTDYDIGGWMDRVPTMAAAAFHHGRGRTTATAKGARPKRKAPTLDGVLADAAEFARNDYARFLAQGAAMPGPQRAAVMARLGDLIGLPPEIVDRCQGRVPVDIFVRELLRDEGKVVGFYDTTITASDPFPDRSSGWADPTLSGITPAFTMAVNRLLRGELGVDTDREYTLLSLEVNQAWRNDADHHAFDAPIPGATDDFRYGLALNPHLQTFITHGRHDLVTPYATSDRLRDLMRLDPATAARVTVRHFHGGHMFYAWESSRREFTAAIAAFVAGCLGGA